MKTKKQKSVFPEKPETKIGRPKAIKSPEELWFHFESYKTKTKSNPIKIKDWVGKDAIEVNRERERPLTMDGFENYCSDIGLIEDLGQYFENRNKAYNEFFAICSRVKKAIRQDQIEGGMSGIYNPSITQRLNNLVDKQEIKLPKVGKDAEEETYE